MVDRLRLLLVAPEAPPALGLPRLQWAEKPVRGQAR
jgi:hypothetical protein